MIKNGITICMPVYNNEHLLYKALESINKQDYDKELIIVHIINDGDNRLSEMIDIINNFPNLHIIYEQNNKNIGILNTRLRTWYYPEKKINTEYIYNLDPDDELGDYDCLSKLIEVANEMDVVYGSIKVVGNVWDIQPERAKKEERTDLIHNYLWGKLLRTSTLYKTLDNIDIWTKHRIDCNEDTLIMTMFRTVSHKYTRIPKIIYKYHMNFDNNESISCNKTLTDKRFDMLISSLYVWHYMIYNFPNLTLQMKNWLWRRREQLIWQVQTIFGTITENQKERLRKVVLETNPCRIEDFGFTKTVSILIPVYRREGKIFRRALQSVIAQTYDHKKLEVITVNDGDNEIDEYINDINWFMENSDIKIIPLIHNKNKGIFEARKTLIEYANNEYLTFLDSDDELTPNAIKSLCGASLIADQIRGRRCEVESNLQQPLFSSTELMPIDNLYQYAMDGKCFVALWSQLFRTDIMKEAINNLSYINFRIDTDEDSVINWEFQKLAKNYQMTNELVYKVHTDVDSITRGTKKNDRLLERPFIYETMLKHTNTIAEKAYILYRYIVAVYQVHKELKENVTEDILNRINEIKEYLTEDFCVRTKYTNTLMLIKEYFDGI